MPVYAVLLSNTIGWASTGLRVLVLKEHRNVDCRALGTLLGVHCWFLYSESQIGKGMRLMHLTLSRFV